MISALVVAGIVFAQIPLPQSQTGTATGVILATTGMPAAGVRVAAQALTDSTAGIGEGALVSLTQTDSAGRYRLENIPPGRYYIQAGLVDFPTYYPGVTTTTGATSVQITAGSALERINFTLARATGVRVSGRVPLGNVRPVMVRLTGGSVGIQSTTSQVKPDGTFEFLRVPPGNYSLMATPNNGLPTLPLVVNDKDIDVGVPTGPGFKVSGVVGLGPRSARVANQKVVLTGSSAWAQLETSMDADGKFELTSVPPGSYSLRTLPGAAGSQATIVVADREVNGVVVPGFVELLGVVVLQDGQKFPALSPALMVQARSVKGASLATAIRSDGGFRFPLVEGEYRISLGKLPAGMSVKSIGYGAMDLLNAPLKLDGVEAPGEIRVTMEFRRE